MPLNIEKYLPYLDEYNWSRDVKIEMLQWVWRMTEAETDKVFGLHPVQLACGQNKNNPSQTRQKSLDSKSTLLSTNYRRAANDNDGHTPTMKGKHHVA